jgi:hypothetical protein
MSTLSGSNNRTLHKRCSQHAPLVNPSDRGRDVICHNEQQTTYRELVGVRVSPLNPGPGLRSWFTSHGDAQPRNSTQGMGKRSGPLKPERAIWLRCLSSGSHEVPYLTREARVKRPSCGARLQIYRRMADECPDEDVAQVAGR